VPSVQAVVDAIDVCSLAQHELKAAIYAVLVGKTRRARERERKRVCVREKERECV